MWRNSILALLVSLVIQPAYAADDPNEMDGVDLGVPSTDLMPQVPRDGVGPAEPGVLANVPFQTFSANNGGRYYSIAVSQQGNLTRFVSPVGYNMLWNEGYIACSSDPAGVRATAYEWGGEASGWSVSGLWGAPIITDLSPLTIERTTTDGRLFLKQKFAADKNELDFTITMVLKNISGQTLSDVRLERWANIDIDVNDYADDWASRSGIGAYVFENRGLVLDALSATGTVTTILDGVLFSQCGSTGANVPGPVGANDHMVKVSYAFGTLRNGVSKTVKFRYSRL
jgi:hypothetical protein